MGMKEVRSILNDIKQGHVKPVYFLSGEEPFFIDTISKYIEDHLLQDHEKSFNQTVFYGRETTVDDVMTAAKRYPMMADRQVVIVKEAQHLWRTIEQFEPYVSNPQPSTVLVVCYKNRTLDKRRKLAKEVRSRGVLFEGKKIYENRIPDWISQAVKARGFSISIKGAHLMAEFLGSDLSMIDKELEKLAVICKPGTEITPEVIEENIGISKDYNNFELLDAIGSRNAKKTFAIVGHFAENPGNYPLVLTLSLLHTFFTRILKYHALSNKRDAPRVLGINPFFVKDYQTAAANYSMKQASAAIAVILETDRKSKGVGASAIPQEELLKELCAVLIR